MKYPKFLHKESTIGITAPSCGVGEYTEAFNISLNNIKKYVENIKETSNVRTKGDVSSPSKVRAKELHELYEDRNIDMIMCASGGDFLTDMLPFVDLDVIKNNPKWIMGASDPTNLLYLITTALDISTMYGHNAGSFDSEKLHGSQIYALNTIIGIIDKQNSYDYYEKDKNSRINGNYNTTEKVIWKTDNKLDVSGRIIGGCIDCLKYLPGTKYDYTKNFIEKYKDNGIIWYFDIFNMSAEDFYLTLFQLKEANWFNYVKAVIIGRVFIPSSYTTMTYEKAAKEIFKSIPIIMNADIGHVCPKMTIINGSIAHITCDDGKGQIEFSLK